MPASGVGAGDRMGSEAVRVMQQRSSYEYEDLLACGRGEMFGPGNAQLPLPPMLMFDRIAEISESGGPHGKGLIRAELAKYEKVVKFSGARVD